MKIETKAAVYGLAGLAVAGLVIFSGATLGVLKVQQAGVLSVLLTDPPSVPTGVTAIYITYTDVAVHAEGLGDSGWVTVSGEGTVNTMKLVNLSQTISSGSIPALSYNQVRFKISNASVQFMGKNFSVSVKSGDIEVPIVGGLKVNTSNLAAALIDIQPTVLNLGDQSLPSFTMAAGARALQVPASEVDASTHQMGHMTPLGGHDWYDSFKSRSTVNLTVSGIGLTHDSFSFSAANAGSDPVTLTAVVIAPSLKGGGESFALGSVVNGAAFAVQSDGSLRLVSGNPGQAEALLDATGYSIGPGSSHQFSYSGAISNVLGNRGIAAGVSYYIIIMGPGTLSVETAVAS